MDTLSFLLLILKNLRLWLFAGLIYGIVLFTKGLARHQDCDNSWTPQTTSLRSGHKAFEVILLPRPVRQISIFFNPSCVTWQVLPDSVVLAKPLYSSPLGSNFSS